MKKKKYSKVGSIWWAIQNVWQLDKWFVIWVFTTVPLEVILPLVTAWFSKELLDQVGKGAGFEKLAMVILGFLGLEWVLRFLRNLVYNRLLTRENYLSIYFQRKMDMQDNYLSDYENLEKQDYQKVRGYAWREVGSGDCSLENWWQDISKTLQDVGGIITYASLLVVLNPVIFLVVAAVSALSYVTTRWRTSYYEKHKEQWEKEIRKKRYLQQISEDFTKAKESKLYGMDKWLNQMLQDYQSYLLFWNKRCSLRGMWAAMPSGVMTLLQNGVAYVVLIGILLNDGITVGEFIFYFSLTGSIAGFLQGIIGDIAKLNHRAEKIIYYREFFDYPTVFNREKGCELPKAPVKIELKDVWYRYEGAEDYTLKGINLTIEGGENLALVGMNGAGKTTLVKLITGMYRPTKGEILVGSKRIDEYNIYDYYSMISAVFQEIKPIAFTMFEFVANADLERPTAREDAIQAMKAAGIYEKIESLVHGIDTHLMKGFYDDGVDLSGGEMQKLMLARAIYKDGAILVLDEPTAALDPIAENQLYLKYQDLTEGKTSIYISHRFASTRFCDRIVLLENGVLTECGTHEELMKKNGQYAYLFGVQSQYYKEGEVHA